MVMGFVLAALAGSSASSYTVRDLEWIASTDAVLEISHAAGLALVDTYAATKSVDELTELAGSTRVGIALAARLALRALDDPLATLVVLSPEELAKRARRAATSEERSDAARGYFLVARGTLTLEGLEREAARDASMEWALAAGEALGGFYATYRILSTDALVDEAVTNPHPGLRRAASVALAARWMSDGLALTDAEIEVKLVELSQWKPDLAAAYRDVLVHRFVRGLENR